MSCPICKKPTEKAYRPFCSKRCADIDLAKWLNEDYSVPAREEDPFSEDAEAQYNPSDRLH